MNNGKKLIMALMAALLIGCLGGYSALASASSENNNVPKSISYQPQTTSVMGNTVNDSPTAELPGGNVDYSVYEPYGLLYDQENHYYTYFGNIVRFFNDPMAGASFTNFFSGTVDIEAVRDTDNKLIGIIECSKEIFDQHTRKCSGINLTGGTSSTTQEGGNTSSLWLKDYADYGITYNTKNGGWYYNGQRIKFLVDDDQTKVYLNEENGICISVIRNSEHEILEIKEISETDAQLLLQNNNPAGGNYTTQE